MRYIGDLSAADAAVLEELARNSAAILEFGSGGSTQIFAQAAPRTTRIISVETEPAWIDRTRRNLELLHARTDVEFWSWKEWERAPHASFDLIFDDGIDKRRLEFALRAWDRLPLGGKLLFHDTRRERDFRNVARFLERNFLEVDAALINWRGSNTTVISKKLRQPWEDWNVVEKRQRWEYGHADPPPGLWGDPPGNL